MVGLGQEGVPGRCGELSKILKRQWSRKERRGNKHLKKGGELGQGVGAIKRWAETPLRSMIY